MPWKTGLQNSNVRNGKPTRPERWKRNAPNTRRLKGRWEAWEVQTAPVRDHAFVLVESVFRRAAAALGIGVEEFSEWRGGTQGDYDKAQLHKSSESLMLSYRRAGEAPDKVGFTRTHTEHETYIFIEDDAGDFSLLIRFDHVPFGREYGKRFKRTGTVAWRHLDQPIASEIARWVLTREGTPWSLLSCDRKSGFWAGLLK